MRFYCGETLEAKEDRLNEWHPFFALFPRRIGPRECAWFEWIERRGFAYGGGVDWYWKYEYRARPVTK